MASTWGPPRGCLAIDEAIRFRTPRHLPLLILQSIQPSRGFQELVPFPSEVQDLTDTIDHVDYLLPTHPIDSDPHVHQPGTVAYPVL